MMRITFLGSGTSSGVPVPTCHCEVCRSADPRDNRLRASILVETCGQTILVDCGPDFRQQALRMDLQHIDAVLLTHIHYDHSAGIDDLRIYSYRHPLPLYAEPRVAAVLREKYDYAFAHPYPGAPRIDLRELQPMQVEPHEADVPEFAPIRIGDVDVVPIRLMHGSLPIVGFRIGQMAYLTDCTAIADAEWPRLADIDTLIVDALRWEPHRTHFSVGQALEVVDRLHPRVAYLTHMSHDLGLHAEAESRLPDGVHFAYDGLVVSA